MATAQTERYEGQARLHQMREFLDEADALLEEAADMIGDPAGHTHAQIQSRIERAEYRIKMVQRALTQLPV